MRHATHTRLVFYFSKGREWPEDTLAISDSFPDIKQFKDFVTLAAEPNWKRIELPDLVNAQQYLVEFIECLKPLAPILPNEMQFSNFVNLLRKATSRGMSEEHKQKIKVGIQQSAKKFGARSGNRHRLGKTRKYRRSEIAELVRLRSEGHSFREIAATCALGVTFKSVGNILAKYDSGIIEYLD